MLRSLNGVRNIVRGTLSWQAESSLCQVSSGIQKHMAKISILFPRRFHFSGVEISRFLPSPRKSLVASKLASFLLDPRTSSSGKTGLRTSPGIHSRPLRLLGACHEASISPSLPLSLSPSLNLVAISPSSLHAGTALSTAPCFCAASRHSAHTSLAHPSCHPSVWPSWTSRGRHQTW